MRNLAIIPARSGSKGLINKNIKMLNGKPLMAYTIEAAQKSKMFDEIFVSTDSEKYAKIAHDWGASVPFLRSERLSSDAASSWIVTRDAIKRFQRMGQNFDTIALLQPTSPLRTSEDIIAAYKLMAEKDANAVVAICGVDHSPLWMNILPEDALLTNFINKDIANIPRQDLPTYYRINGAIYITKTDYLMNTNNIYEEKCYAFIMSKEHSIDIDDIVDFKVAETLMNIL